MNYERMLVSPVVRMNYSVYLNVLQWLSLCCMQLRGMVGEQEEVGQEGSCEGKVLCQCVSACCISGISALNSR